MPSAPAPDAGLSIANALIYVFCVPVLLVAFLTLLRAVAKRKPLEWNSSLDISIDLTLVAIGATGEAFQSHLQGHVAGLDPVTGLYITIVSCFVWIILLFYLRMVLRRATKSVTKGWAFFLCGISGALTLGCTILKCTGQ